MQATLNLVVNPFHPLKDLEQIKVGRKSSVTTLIRRHKIDLSKPVICRYNGEVILRKRWNKTVVRDGDVVDLIWLPRGGGGGSNPLRIILTISVMAFAAWAAPALAGSMGITSQFGIGLVKMGIGMLGNMLVNALVPPPKAPTANRADLNSPSPTYSLSAQGNQARLGQPIPVIYGEHRVYPDFVAQPFTEYEDNDQYLYQLFCIGQGYFELPESEIKIQDTAITNFSDITYEIVQPGGKTTLFPDNVVNVGEVSGQDIPYNTSIGWFVANAAGTVINQLAFDAVFPRGLYYANDEGSLDERSVTFQFMARRIDEFGNVLEVLNLGSNTVSGKTQEVIRKTYKYNVPSGRYEIAAMRTSVKSTNTRVGNELIWGAARGYLVGSGVSYDGVTMLAVKMKATNNLSETSSRRVNVLARRKLPIPSYNPATNTVSWSEPVFTQSIAWAIADMCRAVYGAQVNESRFNVLRLIALHSEWEARGDRLNGVFDSIQGFWEALSMACRVGRARPFIQAGMIHFVRDKATVLPTAMFSSRNIVKNTFKVSYLMKAEETADCVDVEYFDRQFWKNRTVRAELEGYTATKPARVQLFGVTDRAHAWREGMYSAASNRYRRKEISFETELEGHIPALGDLIAVQSDIPEWGQVAEVISFSGSEITVNEDFEWTVGVSHYAMLRKADGSVFGPVSATKAGADNKILLGVVPDFDILTGNNKEKTHCVFGRQGAVQLARITSIVPRSRTVAIDAVNEDPRVHSADGTTMPPDELSWSLQRPTVRPVVAGLILTQTGFEGVSTLSASWLTSPSASLYVVETSTDNENWARVGETRVTNLTFSAPIGTIFVRVAAVGVLQGPWSVATYEVGTVPPPADVQNMVITQNGSSFNFTWSEVSGIDSYVLEILADGAVKRTVEQIANTYSYTWDKAQSDGGPWRQVTARVKAKRSATLSLNWASQTSDNNPPAAPSVITTGAINAIAVDVSPCLDDDYEGTMIWASTDPDFVPGPANLVYDGPSYFYIINEVTEPLYVRAAHYDSYGAVSLNVSPRSSATPKSSAAGMLMVTELPLNPAAVGGQQTVYLDVADEGIRGIYGWTGTAWVRVAGLSDNSVTESTIQDGAIVARHIVSGAITAEKINVNNLQAISATMGDLTSGTITLDLTSHIKGGQTAFDTGYGFFMGHNGSDYVMSLKNVYGRGFTFNGSNFTVNGNGVFSGSLNAASGTFAGSLSAASGTFVGNIQAAGGTFSGTLTANAINAIDTINVRGGAISSTQFVAIDVDDDETGLFTSAGPFAATVTTYVDIISMNVQLSENSNVLVSYSGQKSAAVTPSPNTQSQLANVVFSTVERNGAYTGRPIIDLVLMVDGIIVGVMTKALDVYAGSPRAYAGYTNGLNLVDCAFVFHNSIAGQKNIAIKVRLNPGGGIYAGNTYGYVARLRSRAMHITELKR